MQRIDNPTNPSAWRVSSSHLPAQHRQVLPELHHRLAGSGIQWAITGSCCLALQGVAIAPSDIDILTTRQDLYRFPRLFADHIERGFAFSRLRTLRSHFGVLRIFGVRVEVMAEPEDWQPGVGWCPDVQAGWRFCRRYVRLEDLSIPVLSLAFERRVYKVLGQRAKLDLLSQLDRSRLGR
ncbi:MAG: hypothetical protein AAF657_02240 [Acidobacteriota bacterium]